LSERRTEILDAALRVLAAQGMRGLTHRAVDAEIGIAAGSTSYYFRSRSALVAGCVERLLEIDMRAEVPLVNAGERPPGFTWREPGSGEESVVTVELAELGVRTEMTFHQAGFSSDASRSGVHEGWASSFERLADLFPPEPTPRSSA
jgi:AcrR family transcriptional regulator